VDDGAPAQRTQLIRKAPDDAFVARANSLPDFVALAEKVDDSIVSIVSTVRIPEADSPAPQRSHEGVEGSSRGRLRGIGSGIIITSDGQILTNEHVVRGAVEVSVELHKNRSVPATIVFADPKLDLALLRVAEPVAALRPIELRDTPVKVGEWVMAIGQPFALGNTVTVGVISGLGRDHSDLGRPPDLDPQGYWSFIQTDASINVGNSGGPLVDRDGKVVGITTAVRSDGQGLAFAIPASMARHFWNEVNEHGSVRHPRLGLRAENAGPRTFPGRMAVVRVTGVDRSSSAASAGLKPGDLLLSANGSALHRVSELAWLAQLNGADTTLELEVGRPDGSRRVVLLPLVDPG
jgi:S1-C subfamily serine protease